MKIVYVGDNRTRGNYGCRATSTALSQIIGEEHEIVGVIHGTYTNVDTGELFFSKHYPKWVYNKVGKMKYAQYFKTVAYIFHRMLKRGRYYFSKYDFISYDLDQSIENLLRCLPANPHLQEFDLRQYDFDALVVNGEGSFIFATPPWRECLIEAMMMHWAQKMGKKVYYLNGMLSDDPYFDSNEKTKKIIHNLFKKSEVVAVREEYSYQYALKNFSNINLKQFPDALFSWYDLVNDNINITNGRYVIGMSNATDASFKEFDFTKPYICVSGSSSVGLATKNEREIISIYSSLVNEIKEKFDMNVFLVEVCEGDAFLREVSKKTKTPMIPLDTPILAAAKILANARVLISGRYHPSILASLGGTPCVFMSSNSHKTKSIQELLEYENCVEFSVLPDKEEREKIIQLAEKKLALGEGLRTKIQSRAKWLSEETKKQKDLLK
ncbi:MAG: polysaccharide pyruvyl transferase family protein [Bacilli bacterium]|jgi:exopolysaccharide biosynthesis predicted pyruvyltransferase EpsI|nr:polysaccharide pyruvyl transferase family protein [Bacilli bacterium]